MRWHGQQLLWHGRHTHVRVHAKRCKHPMHHDLRQRGTRDMHIELRGAHGSKLHAASRDLQRSRRRLRWPER